MPKPKLEHAFIVEGRPKPKGRPRMTRRGRVYTPKETLEYEAKIAEAEAYGAPSSRGRFL